MEGQKQLCKRGNRCRGRRYARKASLIDVD
jgi:hypothetical protein